MCWLGKWSRCLEVMGGKKKNKGLGGIVRLSKAERRSKSLESFAAIVALGAAMAEPRESQAGGLAETQGTAQPLSLDF